MSEVSVHRWVDEPFEKAFRSHWRWRVGEGFFVILLGVFSLLTALIFPPQIIDSMGYALVFVGVVRIAATLAAPKLPGVSISLALALVEVLGGICLLRIGLGEPASLARVFVLYFSLSGTLGLFLGLVHRRQICEQWEWLVVSGVTSLILALIILGGLPGPFTWMLGVLLGIELLFKGSAVLSVALSSNEVMLGGTEAAVPMTRSIVAT